MRFFGWRVRVTQVAVVDASGAVVPTASDVVTFSVSGPGMLVGTSNGDPASLVNNQSPARPTFHGLVLGVVAVGDEVGLVSALITNMPVHALLNHPSPVLWGPFPSSCRAPCRGSCGAWLGLLCARFLSECCLQGYSAAGVAVVCAVAPNVAVVAVLLLMCRCCC
jgi:hypothetical protein